ncbi:aminotransferase class III-fold pyridoxal phosphate-dependent enzyme [Fulvivirgaceae bacterium BMA12]|uniref:Aminotransferase class III-fold pyridoxal phosphate-dependent enzyme n=1 Tax=Agaribacillus aureus TaxID=3051825 RepID=A0ABT8LA68_9BACT|nr:aminotransferase class III-fold pyridoxal phosphate-dependent enzyme [Fulvivirgaceae bacterium BMA12]
MNLFEVYPLFDLEPVKGSGSYIFDGKGNAYLDLYGGHAVISVGHSHPYYVNMIEKQLKRLGFYSNSVINGLQTELAAKLGELSGYNDYQLFLCNSGAEAIENALKLASFHTNKEKVIAFNKGFHGRTSAAVSITDNPKIQAPVNQNHQVTFIGLNDLNALETHLKTETYCAVVVEGIQGIAGIITPSPSFLQSAEKLCQKYGALLILDEIQSGYARTGKFFAHDDTGIRPDIITTAKGMGNGFPMAGVLINPAIKPSLGMLGTTFGGSHLACAAGIAVLDIIKDENLVDHAKTLGDWWLQALAQIDNIKEIRGQGLMIALEFDFPIKELRKFLLTNERIITGSSSDPKVLRLLPALNIGKEELIRFNTALQSALNQLDSIAAAEI